MAGRLRALVTYRSTDPQGLRQLWKPIVETTGANVFAMGASAVTVFITARYLGPDGRGVLAAASSWVNLFSTLGTFSIGSVIIHHAVERQGADWLPDVAGTLLLLVGATTLCGWLLAGSMYVASSGAAFSHLSPGVMALAFFSLPLLIWNEDSRGVLYALGQLRSWNVVSVSLGAFVTIGAWSPWWRCGAAASPEH